MGIDPDRLSFTTATQTARDPITHAANVIAETTIHLVGTIGGHLLDNPMPARRLRVSPRTVKRPLSRYAYKSLGVDRRAYLTTLTIDITAGRPALTIRGTPNFTASGQRPDGTAENSAGLVSPATERSLP